MDDDKKMIFAKNLKKLVDASGHTQREVSKRMGIPEQTFGNWTVGRYVPDPVRLAKICDYFHVTQTELFNEHNSEGRYDITALFEQLDSANQERAIGYIRALLEMQK